MIEGLIGIAAFLATIMIIVTVHEFGHYIFARKFGVRVLRFSVGFGKPLLRFRASPEGTEWVIAPLPLGGYVRMLDLQTARENGLPESGALEAQSVAKRALIMAAGPAANFLLSFILYFFLALPGTIGARPLIGEVVADSPAARAGLVAGDEIAAINGSEVATWSDAYWRILDAASARDAITVSVIGGGQREIAADDELIKESAQGNLLAAAGLYPDDSYLTTRLSLVLPQSPAEVAGLRSGDVVVAVNERVIDRWGELARAINAHPRRDMSLVIFREEGGVGELITLSARPEAREDSAGIERGRLGITPQVDMEKLAELRVTVNPGPAGALSAAARRTVDGVVITFRFLGLLFGGQLPMKAVSGPIGIARDVGDAASAGAGAFFAFVALLSISLGAINLLPIPVLDGGHLALCAVEFAYRKPLPEKWLRGINLAGFVIVLLLMLLVIANDIARLWD